MIHCNSCGNGIPKLALCGCDVEGGHKRWHACPYCLEPIGPVEFIKFEDRSRTVEEIRSEVVRMIENVHTDARLPVMDREAWTTDGAILHELERLIDFIDGK